MKKLLEKMESDANQAVPTTHKKESDPEEQNLKWILQKHKKTITPEMFNELMDWKKGNI